MSLRSERQLCSVRFSVRFRLTFRRGQIIINSFCQFVRPQRYNQYSIRGITCSAMTRILLFLFGTIDPLAMIMINEVLNWSERNKIKKFKGID